MICAVVIVVAVGVRQGLGRRWRVLWLLNWLLSQRFAATVRGICETVVAALAIDKACLFVARHVIVLGHGFCDQVEVVLVGVENRWGSRRCLIVDAVVCGRAVQMGVEEQIALFDRWLEIVYDSFFVQLGFEYWIVFYKVRNIKEKRDVSQMV